MTTLSRRRITLATRTLAGAIVLALSPLAEPSAHAQPACDASLIAGWKKNTLQLGISKLGPPGMPSSSAPFDAWIASMMQDHPKLTDNGTATGAYPGITIAVTKAGKLVFTRAYGFSDRDAGQPANVDDLFRLGSISKSFTGMAVLKIIESGNTPLHLGTTVGNLAQAMNVTVLDANFAATTVDQLLRQTSGFEFDTSDPWTTSSQTCPQTNSCNPVPVDWEPTGDPWDVAINGNFASSPPTSAQVFTYMAENKYLKWTTGTPDYTGEKISKGVYTGQEKTTENVYTYYNFNYVVLELMLTYVAGYSSYASAVGDTVLTPLGITRMQIASDTQQDGEVKYYDYFGAGNVPSVYDKYAYTDGPGGGPNNTVKAPYGGIAWYDGPGGYIGSSIDLLNFLVAVDGRWDKTSIINANTFGTMTLSVPNHYCPVSSTLTVCESASDLEANWGGWPGQAAFWVYGTACAKNSDCPTGSTCISGQYCSTPPAGWAMDKNGGFAGTTTYLRRHSDDANMVFMMSSAVAPGASEVDYWDNLPAAYTTALASPGFLDEDLTDQYVPVSSWINDSQFGAVYTANLAAGLYPFKVEGRWSTSGNTYQWRVAWAPLHSGWSWGMYYSASCTAFEAENTQMLAMGAQLANLQWFAGPDSQNHYQATWVFVP